MNNNRQPGDQQLYEEELAGLVNLRFNQAEYEYECEHMIAPISRYERGWIRLAEPHPEFGVQVRRCRMCCKCYQILHRAGVAPASGMWEGIAAQAEGGTDVHPD